MRYLVVGCGNVGMELARQWSSAGHDVVGTTTSPERVAEVAEVCARVEVLRGADAQAMARAAEGVDGIALTVSPRLSRSLNPGDRIAEYADTLTATAQCAAQTHPRVVFASSTSVYGAARAGTGAIDEDTPVTDSTDASPVNFLAAERAVLAAQGVVVRLPDVYGHPRDIDYVARVRFGHDMMGGAVPFAADSLLYRIDYRDAAAALAHVMGNGLTGIFNAAPDAVVPGTNDEIFGAIADAEGWPRLRYKGEIEGPTRPITSARLRGTGFAFVHSTPA